MDEHHCRRLPQPHRRHPDRSHLCRVDLVGHLDRPRRAPPRDPAGAGRLRRAVQGWVHVARSDGVQLSVGLHFVYRWLHRRGDCHQVGGLAAVPALVHCRRLFVHGSRGPSPAADAQPHAVASRGRVRWLWPRAHVHDPDRDLRVKEKGQGKKGNICPLAARADRVRRSTQRGVFLQRVVVRKPSMGLLRQQLFRVRVSRSDKRLEGLVGLAEALVRGRRNKPRRPLLDVDHACSGGA
eukprot:Amastigsp_a350629_10.p3 type:complete len:238 gc:universal Amastigsp_a350629_10:376-1089(+)